MFLSNYLSSLRTNKKLSKTKLSEFININREKIKRIELDEYIPSNNELKKYSDYFNIPLEKLINLKIERLKKDLDISYIGSYLNFLRKKEDMTQSIISKKLDIPITLIRKIEKNDKIPTKSELEKYSKLFDISLEYLMNIRQKTMITNIDQLSLNDYLIFLRKTDNLTQKECAKLLDISFKELREIENNRRIPKYNTLEKYAEIFNIPIENLLKSTANFKVKKIAEVENKQTDTLESLREKENLLLFNQFNKGYQVLNIPLYNSKESFLEKKSHTVIEVLMSKDMNFTDISNLFGYRIHDNAMNQVLAVNTVAIVDSQLKPKDDNIIMFKFKNQLYIRRLKVLHDTIYLNSESWVDNKLNFSFSKEHFDHFEFLGTVIHVIIDNYYINH